MVLVKFALFVFFEISCSLLFMWNSLNVNNCWRRQNFENCSTWPHVHLWWTFRICCYLWVKHNYAETFYLYKGYKWLLKFRHRYRNVRIRFFWGELQVSIARKRDFKMSSFLTKLHPGSMAFTNEWMK